MMATAPRPIRSTPVLIPAVETPVPPPPPPKIDAMVFFGVVVPPPVVGFTGDTHATPGTPVADGTDLRAVPAGQSVFVRSVLMPMHRLPSGYDA